MECELPVLETRRLILTIPGAPAAAAWVEFHRVNAAHLAPWNPALTAASLEIGACERMLDERAADARDGAGYAFCVFDRRTGPSGPLLGYLNFSQIVRGVFLACYMGYALAGAAQGKGYMTEAAAAGIDFIFDRVRLHRIMANYMPANTRSAAVLERLGFTIEGAASRYLYLAGAWQDHVLTSLINPNPVTP